MKERVPILQRLVAIVVLAGCSLPGEACVPVTTPATVTPAAVLSPKHVYATNSLVTPPPSPPLLILPPHAGQIRLTWADGGSEVMLHVGQRIEVDLPYNPTGFGMSTPSTSNNAVMQLVQIATVDDSSRSMFVAKQRGLAELVARLACPNT